MARTLASIIREIRLIETSGMKDTIKAAAIAKLNKEAEDLHTGGDLGHIGDGNPRQGHLPVDPPPDQGQPGQGAPKGKR